LFGIEENPEAVDELTRKLETDIVPQIRDMVAQQALSSALVFPAAPHPRQLPTGYTAAAPRLKATTG